MGKLMQPQLLADFAVVRKEEQWGEIEIVTLHFVFNDGDNEIFEAVFGETDCVSNYETSEPEGMITKIIVTIDPRYDAEEAYRYLVQAVLRKMHPRNWRRFAQLDFYIVPTV